MASLHAYLVVNFWAGVIGCTMRAGVWCVADKTIPQRIASLLILLVPLFFTVWAYVLLGW